MRKIKSKIIISILVLAAISGFVLFKIKNKSPNGEIIQEINPTVGNIQTFISTTGTVLPKNRLAVKPPVNGRIDSILVQEGDKIKLGQTLAWMSSTERAALLDAAQGQGEEVIKYWKQVYKPIALLSPIDGEVIVATTQPGQTMTTADAVVVLSDHLIVRAQVDETDIGKIKLGQEAIITLDAYPDKKINANTEHIYYESQTINNVTIYNVDLLPIEVPPFFRSGMNATVDFKSGGNDKALMLPVEAVHKEKGEIYVLLKEAGNKDPVKQPVTLGITDDKNYEILSGLNIKNTVLIKTKKYMLPSSNLGSNPFSPFGQRKQQNK